MNFRRVTQDRNWLELEGFPLLSEVADFWVSRVEENENGAFDINNVVAADEHAENVDNNALLGNLIFLFWQRS